jgi:hypothetical protein
VKDQNDAQGLGLSTIRTRKVDKRLATRSERSLCCSSSSKTLSREFSKYMLDVVGVENGRWKKGSTKPAEEYDFSVDGRTEIISYVRDMCRIPLSCELSREQYVS